MVIIPCMNFILLLENCIITPHVIKSCVVKGCVALKLNIMDVEASGLRYKQVLMRNIECILLGCMIVVL